jgi:hypothetical protein
MNREECQRTLDEIWPFLEEGPHPLEKVACIALKDFREVIGVINMRPYIAALPEASRVAPWCTTHLECWDALEKADKARIKAQGWFNGPKHARAFIAFTIRYQWKALIKIGIEYWPKADWPIALAKAQMPEELELALDTCLVNLEAGRLVAKNAPQLVPKVMSKLGAKTRLEDLVNIYDPSLEVLETLIGLGARFEDPRLLWSVLHHDITSPLLGFLAMRVPKSRQKEPMVAVVTGVSLPTTCYDLLSSYEARPRNSFDENDWIDCYRATLIPQLASRARAALRALGLPPTREAYYK